jgi:hypothetical protein
MKKEDAIHILTAMKKSYLSLGIPDPEAVEALELAINAVKAEPCEDMALQYAKGYNDGFMEGIKHNRPKSGEWIRDGSMIECSVCECRMPKELQGVTGAILDLQTEYCPNCGAKMEEEE